MAQIERSAPAYVQIAEHYQRLIGDGTLVEGERLPSVRQLAEEWGVVRATANRAMKYLAAAQLIEVTKGGAYVRPRRVVPAPSDRIRLAISDRWLTSEHVEVREAGLVRKAYVANILGLEDDAEVIRREQVTYRDSQPIMLSVHWLPGDFAAAAPELTTTEALNAVAVVERATGRIVTRGTDSLTARSSDEREASALHIPVGAPVHAVIWVWQANDTVIEYGEYVSPAEHAVVYEYEVSRPEGATA
jgi:GntR family transcriptional regulator